MKKLFNVFITFIFILVVAALLLTAFGYRFQKASSADVIAMFPTIGEGDYFLVNTNYNVKDIKRGDIVAIDKLNYPSQLIRRIIGLENDNIEIKDGEIYLNNKRLIEPYASNLQITAKDSPDYFIQNKTKITIPSGKLFIVGDNRINSVDSRNSTFGLVDVNSIKGKLVRILLSKNLDKIGKSF
ncbi:MAG: signal peptidase I [Ignavibacteriaceae bacterium]